MSAARARRANVNLLHLVRREIVLLHQVEDGRNRSVGERLGGKRLHAALGDAPGVAQPVGQPVSKKVELPLRAEAVGQPLLAVHHMLGAGVAFFRQQRGEDAALGGHRVHCVLHHGELARGHRAQSDVVAGGDADGVLDLLPTQMQRAPRNDGRDESRQRGVMPATLPDAGKGGFAKPHLKLVTQHQAHHQLAPITLRALAAGQSGREEVRGMRRVLFPVNVVVVHHADHERVGEGGRDGVHSAAGPDHRRRPRTGDFLEHLKRDAHVVLAVASQRAAQRVEQKALGLVDGFRRKLFERQARCPLGHFGGDGWRHIVWRE